MRRELESNGKKSHQLKKNPHSREGWMKDKKAGRPLQVWDKEFQEWFRVGEEVERED